MRNLIAIVCGSVVCASVAWGQITQTPPSTFNGFVLYDVNKKVGDYKDCDTASPEAFYATYNRIMAGRDKEVLARLRELDFFQREWPQRLPQREIDNLVNMPEDWAGVLTSATILKVSIFGGKTTKGQLAVVVAKLDGENTRNPFDLRWLCKKEDKWLNVGNDRCDSAEEALMKFAFFAQERLNTLNTPKIATAVPANGAEDVDAGTVTEVRVTFDRDMNTDGYAWCGGGDMFPNTTDKPKWVDKRTCVLPVKLKADKKYRLWLNSLPEHDTFKSEEGVSLQTTEYSFKTKATAEEAKNDADTRQLKGKVAFSDGTPVAEGLIVFESPTFLVRAVIGKDGSYMIGTERDGLPHAGYRVFFSGNDKIDKKFTSSDTSPLQIQWDDTIKVLDFVIDRAAE